MSTRSADAVIDVTSSRLIEGLTPPPAWYCDPALFDRERMVLFPAAWELVSTEVVSPSDQVPRAYDTVAGGVLIWQGRGYVNACPHRGHELIPVGERAAGPALRCGYHGWRFGADGCRPGGAVGALVPVAVDSWGELLFASRRPSQSLLALLGEAPALLDEVGVDLLSLSSSITRSTAYTLACNWKVAVENSLECYHCPVAHPQLRGSADLGSAENLVRNHSRSIGRFRAPASATAGSRTVAHQTHWLFPNQSVATWPGTCPSVLVNRWVPLGPSTTRWELTRYWLGDIDESEVETGWKYSLSFAEQDAVLVEAVQRGIANGWPGGRYVLDGPFPEYGPANFAAAVVGALRQS